MSLTKRVGLLGGVAALSFSGGSFADPASDVTNDELRARIAELESRLAAVEQQDGQNWLTEQRAAEIRSLVQDALADADARSSLLAQGMTAGYDNGAVIASADGNWLLRTNLLLQTRFELNRQDSAGVGNADTVWGFEVTRAKFMLSGNVVSPEWFYRVEIETSGNVPGRGGLNDAYVGYDYGNGWKVYVGSFKVPLLREELVRSEYQLAVERSVVNYNFTGGYTNGVMVDYTGDQFHVLLSYNNGANTGGGSAIAADTDISFSGRAEWLAMGNWDQFMDFTSPQGEETGVMVGGALHYQTAQTDGGVPDVDLLLLTIDAQAEFGGANVFGSFIYTNADTPGTDVNALALVIQGGYYFTESWEGYARYEWADFDVAGTEDLNIITLGVNKYFAGHNAVWTTDIGFALNEVSSNGNAVTGWRTDTMGSDAQFVVRSQLQILF